MSKHANPSFHITAYLLDTRDGIDVHSKIKVLFFQSYSGCVSKYNIIKLYFQLHYSHIYDLRAIKYASNKT